MVALAANKQGPGSDESYVRSGSGRHYLMINSGNITNVAPPDHPPLHTCMLRRFAALLPVIALRHTQRRPPLEK
jgi:hypothetical protein